MIQNSSLGNLYAPNIDDPIFLFKYYRQFNYFNESDNFIMCGDFNLVLNPSADYENYRINNHIKKARDIILAI